MLKMVETRDPRTPLFVALPAKPRNEIYPFTQATGLVTKSVVKSRL